MNAVCASSSWHWVEQREGFAEVARVLQTGGMFGFLWTGPDRSVPWVAQLMAGGAEVSQDLIAEQAKERAKRHRPEVPDDAPFTTPEVRVFRISKQATAEELVGLWGTYSQAIILDDDERNEGRRNVERFVETEVAFVDGEVELPLGCVVWRAARL